MACYLAIQDDPESILCPRQATTNSKTECRYQRSRKPGSRREGIVREPASEPAAAGHKLSTRPQASLKSSLKTTASQIKVAAPGLDDSTKTTSEIAAPEVNPTASSLQKTVVKKDPKSFTQNLFDTLAFKSLEWLSAPNSGNSAALASQDSRELVAMESESSLLFKVLQEDHELGQSNGNAAVEGSSHPANPSMTEQKQDVMTSPLPPQLSIIESDSAHRDVPDLSLRSRKRHSVALLNERRQSVGYSPLKPRRHSSGLPKPTKLAAQCLPKTQAPKLDLPDLPVLAGVDHTGAYLPEVGKQQQKHQSRFARIDGKHMQIPKSSRIPTSEKDDDLAAMEGGRHQQAVVTDGLQLPSKDRPTCDLDLFRPPQTLSKLSYHVVNALHDLITSSDVVAVEERRLRKYFNRPSTKSHRPSDTLATLRHLEVQSYAEQSIYYVLSSPDTLLESFKDLACKYQRHRTGFCELLLHPQSIDEAFRLLLENGSTIVFHSLWQGIETLFAPPPELVPPKSPKSRAAVSSLAFSDNGLSKGSISNSIDAQHRYLTNGEACHIILICFHALVAAVPRVRAGVGLRVRRLRALGKIAPDSPILDPGMTRPVGDWLRCMEVFEDEMAIRLASRLVRGLATRLYFTEVMNTKGTKVKMSTDDQAQDIVALLCAYFQKCCSHGLYQTGRRDLNTSETQAQGLNSDSSLAPWSMSAIVIEWLRTVMLKAWDGKEEVAKLGVMGSAVTVMKCFCE